MMVVATGVRRRRRRRVGPPFARQAPLILLLAPGLEPQRIGRRRLARKLEGRRLKEEKRKKEKAIEEGILMKTREMIECQYRQHCVINAMMALDGVAD